MADPAEPPALEGNPDDLWLDKLKEVALTPITIRGIFLQLTRIHWSDPQHYGALATKLGGFYWHRDEKRRTLAVDYDYNYDPAKLDQRPAIYVGTTDFDFRKVVVDNQRGQSEDRADEEYVKPAGTSVVLRHIGGGPDETLAMGDLSCQFFLGMRKLIQESLKVSSFEVAKLMSSRPFERATQQGDQQFIVDLLMPLEYNAAWLISREGHRLKTVTCRQSVLDYTQATLAATPTGDAD